MIAFTQSGDAKQAEKCYRVYQNFPLGRIRALLEELPEQTVIDGKLIYKHAQHRVLKELYKEKMSEKTQQTRLHLNHNRKNQWAAAEVFENSFFRYLSN